MANMLIAQALIKGDVIDLDEISRETDQDTTEPRGTVEWISFEGENVRIVTDGGTVEVPLGFTVWVFSGVFGK